MGVPFAYHQQGEEIPDLLLAQPLHPGLRHPPPRSSSCNWRAVLSFAPPLAVVLFVVGNQVVEGGETIVAGDEIDAAVGVAQELLKRSGAGGDAVAHRIYAAVSFDESAISSRYFPFHSAHLSPTKDPTWYWARPGLGDDLAGQHRVGLRSPQSTGGFYYQPTVFISGKRRIPGRSGKPSMCISGNPVAQAVPESCGAPPSGWRSAHCRCRKNSDRHSGCSLLSM